MATQRLSVFVLCTLAVAIGVPSRAPASIQETWESQPATDPFAGTGDLTWTGDVGAWSITTNTWPTSPAQDFDGIRSLRSSNHSSLGSLIANETIVTNISSEVNLSGTMQWSVFFSSNSIVIQPNRRADFILLSDTNSIAAIEDPNNSINGYKITLNDPFANANANIPPFSHEDAIGLADSLTLWRVDSSDDRWRVVGSISLGSTMDIRDGWNLLAQRAADGTWSIGFANGAINQTPLLTSLGIDPGAPNPLVFAGGAYAGIGWTAPQNTTNDHTDFGFDNFSVQSSIPEPSMFVIYALLLSCCALWERGRFRTR